MPATTTARSRKKRDFHSPELEAFIGSLSGLTLAELHRVWSGRLKAPPPPLRSADLLRQLLAWQLQERAFGGLDNSTERILAKVYEAVESGGSYQHSPTVQLSSGVEVTREWKGMVHKVVVNDEGFVYSGKQYGSLSEVARFITGTRWSGPRFFGLNTKSQSNRMAPMDKPLVRCALYTRKSTDEGLDQEFNSLDAQRESCAAYIVSQKRHLGF